MHIHSICVGTGEIGKPIYELIRGVFETAPLDIKHYPETDATSCNYLNVCIPGDLEDFDKIVLDFIERFNPAVVIIHSTVLPGTTNLLNAKVKERNLDAIVFHSPVNGKHANNQMKADLLFYTKLVGYPVECDKFSLSLVENYLTSIGFKVKMIKNPLTTEWSKILSTTYFGLIIAYHQEIERICKTFDLDFDDVIWIFKELKDIRPPHFSGIISGHCVVPNIKLAKKVYDSSLMDWILYSNDLKKGIKDGS